MAQESWNEETDYEAAMDVPVFCTNNCGHVGNPSTLNMCTRCYTDLVLLKPKVSSKTMSDIKVSHPFVGIHTEAEMPASLKASPSSLVPQTSKGRFTKMATSSQDDRCTINRCFRCNKRVGLTAFKCKCAATFCSLHRYSNMHDCSFDYKTAGRDAITKANPIIKADKILKI